MMEEKQKLYIFIAVLENILLTCYYYTTIFFSMIFFLCTKRFRIFYFDFDFIFFLFGFVNDEKKFSQKRTYICTFPLPTLIERFFLLVFIVVHLVCDCYCEYSGLCLCVCKFLSLTMYTLHNIIAGLSATDSLFFNERIQKNKFVCSFVYAYSNCFVMKKFQFFCFVIIMSSFIHFMHTYSNGVCCVHSFFLIWVFNFSIFYFVYCWLSWASL